MMISIRVVTEKVEVRRQDRDQAVSPGGVTRLMEGGFADAVRNWDIQGLQS